MAKEMKEGGKRNAVELFFLTTLIIWLASVSFQILLTHQTQLLYIIAGSFFYQTSNSLIRFFSSKSLLSDPLFVNTAVSLIHSVEIGRACVGKECRSRWSPYH